MPVPQPRAGPRAVGFRQARPWPGLARQGDRFMTALVDRHRTSRTREELADDHLLIQEHRAAPAYAPASPGRTAKEADTAAKALLARLCDLPADSPDRPRVRER